jgi:ArsR family transcriptional regulator
MQGGNMRDLILALKAMADPMRIRILKMLQQKRMCVCELTAVLGIQQSSVSHHLRVLKDAGFVDDIRRGVWIDYELAKKQYNVYVPELERLLSEWLGDDETVREDSKKAKSVDRKNVCQ